MALILWTILQDQQSVRTSSACFQTWSWGNRLFRGSFRFLLNSLMYVRPPKQPRQGWSRSATPLYGCIALASNGFSSRIPFRTSTYVLFLSDWGRWGWRPSNSEGFKSRCRSFLLDSIVFYRGRFGHFLVSNMILLHIYKREFLSSPENELTNSNLTFWSK